MDESNENEPGWEAYVWRGALGGAIGNLLVVLLAAVYVSLRFGNGTLPELLVVGGVFALMGGAIAGLAIGFVIFQTTRKWGRHLNIVGRMLIGSACFLAYLLLTSLGKSPSSRLAFTLVYAVLVGGLTGVMARPKATSDAAPLTRSRV